MPTIPPRDPDMMQEQAEGQQPSDEEMLETVRQGMGGQQPPPGSGMKWENLQEDQAALEQDPSPENVQAFVQYWGEENLPPDLQQQMTQGQGGQ